MGRSLYFQNSFVSGVLEPRLLGRTDIQQYFNGMQQGNGIFLLPQGGVRISPGLRYVDELDATDPPRLFNFPVSETRSYVIAFTGTVVRVYRDNNFLFSIVSGYTSAENKTINSAQLDRSILFTEQEGGIKQLNAPADGIDDTDVNNWQYYDPVTPPVGPGIFITPMVVPQIDYADASSPVAVDDIQDGTFTNFDEGETFKIILNGISTPDITYSESFASLKTNMEKALLDHPLTGTTGVSVTEQAPHPNTVARITLSGASASDYDLITGYATSGDGSETLTFNHVQTGSSRKEDAWSSTRGYPRAITFFAGRLYFANLPLRPSGIFGSKSGDLLNFDLGEQLDDDAIFTVVATNRLNEITNLVSGRNLQILSLGTEFIVPNEIPTPSNFEVRSQTNHGSSFVNPVQIDGSTLFLERKGRTLREYIFSFQEDSYQANNISVLSQHLMKNPVDMSAQKGTGDDDANYVFFCNEDGSITVLNTLRSQQVAGFTSRPLINGKVLSTTVVDDVAYFAVEREINASTVIYLEYFTFDTLLDSSISQTFGGPTDTITGLGHLEGQTVKVIADGSVLLDNVVTGGQITLEREATTVDVGLWQPPIIKPMPLSGEARSGNNQMRFKSVPRTSLRVYETASLKYDGVVVPARFFQPAANSPLNTPPQPYTGIIGDLENNNGWERDQAPIITQEQPGPLTLLAVIYEMESR